MREVQKITARNQSGKIHRHAAGYLTLYFGLESQRDHARHLLKIMQGSGLLHLETKVLKVKNTKKKMENDY